MTYSATNLFHTTKHADGARDIKITVIHDADRTHGTEVLYSILTLTDIQLYSRLEITCKVPLPRYKHPRRDTVHDGKADERFIRTNTQGPRMTLLEGAGFEMHLETCEWFE